MNATANRIGAAKILTAKFAGKCSICDRAFDKGAQIAWQGTASHVDCEREYLAAQEAEYTRQDALHIEHARAFKAGERIRVEEHDGEVYVYDAPTYAMARAAAFDFLTVTFHAAGVCAHFVSKTSKSTGKRTVGRVLVSYYGLTGMSREGWAFRYWQGVRRVAA